MNKNKMNHLHVRKSLAHAFRLTYRMNLHLDEALHLIENEVQMTPEVEHWIRFCRSSKRGLLGLQGIVHAPSDEEEEVEEETSPT